MKNLAILFATLAAAAFGSGCVSLSTLQSARAVPDGQTNAALGLTMAVTSPPGSSNTSIFVPVPELALRHGLGSGFDVGLKAGPLGSQLEFKAEVVSTQRTVISLAPAIGVFYVSNFGGGVASTSVTNFVAHLPLLIGIELPGGHEVLFGPRLTEFLLGQSPGGTSNALLMGGTAAVGFKVSPTLRVQPEFSFASKIAGDGANGGSGFHFGFGFLFGK